MGRDPRFTKPSDEELTAAKRRAEEIREDLRRRTPVVGKRSKAGPQILIALLIVGLMIAASVIVRSARNAEAPADVPVESER